MIGSYLSAESRILCVHLKVSAAFKSVVRCACVCDASATNERHKNPNHRSRLILILLRVYWQVQRHAACVITSAAAAAASARCTRTDWRLASCNARGFCGAAAVAYATCNHTHTRSRRCEHALTHTRHTHRTHRSRPMFTLAQNTTSALACAHRNCNRMELDAHARAFFVCVAFCAFKVY